MPKTSFCIIERVIVHPSVVWINTRERLALGKTKSETKPLRNWAYLVIDLSASKQIAIKNLRGTCDSSS